MLKMEIAHELTRPVKVAGAVVAPIWDERQAFGRRIACKECPNCCLESDAAINATY